ncbi:LysR family transcriptional regulator [Streptomyces sp. NPDC090032]|uniref:LysR family transcriptional regulator n=1 Tax=Streptomyces sp. NPDC090032 TaxID=3365925 RepID=UPI0038057CD3
MEIRTMRAFVTVVEEGGLSAAARRLHISQPALSQTMNTLERELGVRLLVRSPPASKPRTPGRPCSARPAAFWPATTRGGPPLVRRTWAVWDAGSHRRDLGHLLAALDFCGPN